MKVYPEVPEWRTPLFFFLTAVIAVEGWHTDVPVYSLIVTIAVSATYVVPGGLVFAIMGQVVSQTLKGLWELANYIFSYSSHLMFWVKLSLELCVLRTPLGTCMACRVSSLPSTYRQTILQVFKTYLVDMISIVLFLQDLKLGITLNLHHRHCF